jgi:hypothetical protein
MQLSIVCPTTRLTGKGGAIGGEMSVLAGSSCPTTEDFEPQILDTCPVGVYREIVITYQQPKGWGHWILRLA